MGLFPITLESLADPSASDIVFVSVGGSGQLGGQLAQFVLKKLNQESLKLPSDTLKAGSHVLKLKDNKILVLIVTVKGDTNTLRNLQVNLNKAISAIKPDMPNRSIWMAPMGTGGGGLTYEESFRVILDNLFALEHSDFSPQSVMISLPNGLDAKSVASLESKLESWNESLIKDLTRRLKRDEKSGRARDFYAAGHHWGKESQLERFDKDGIWENGHDAPHDLVKYVKVGDVLLAKSSYARPGQGYLRINGVGLVTGNDEKGHALQVNWKTFPSFDLTVGSEYRAVFHLIAQDKVDGILQGTLKKVSDLGEILADLGSSGNRDIERKVEAIMDEGPQIWWVNNEIVSWEDFTRGTQFSITWNLKESKWLVGDLLLVYSRPGEKLLGLFVVVLNKYSGTRLYAELICYFDQEPTKQQLLDTKEITPSELESNEVLSLPLHSFRKLINLTELDIGFPTQEEGINRPHINNDGAYTSEDLLEIENDVRSFALLLAAEEIKPPLAIALLGRWGSGKSFFMKQLATRVTELSEKQAFAADLADQGSIETEGKPPFCQNIAQIEFNAWSYLDDNLWAGLVSSIFEKLDEHITGQSKGDQEKLNIQRKLTEKLKLMADRKAILESEKNELTTKQSELEEQIKQLKEGKDKAIELIQKKSLAEMMKKVKGKLQEKLASDERFNEAELKDLSDAYQELNPEVVYQEYNSWKAFLGHFIEFNRKQCIYFILGLACTLFLMVSGAFGSSLIDSVFR